jgi:V-type H+-transporting ATPase subunit C
MEQRWGPLQVRMSEYNQLKGQMSAINRKQTGSLAVRDLGSLVKPQDAVETENLTTLFVVVPRAQQKEWLSTYETLTEFVVRPSVPRCK